MLKESTRQNICSSSEQLAAQQAQFQLMQSNSQNLTNSFKKNKNAESPTAQLQPNSILGRRSQDAQIKKSLTSSQVQSITQAYQNQAKNNLSESVNEKNNYSFQDLNSSLPFPQRKGRSQKSKMQEQLKEATQSLQAFRDKSNELQRRQNVLKSQYSGLNEKRMKFDQEIGDFTLNSKQLQEYTSEVQRDLKKVSQNQKEVVQGTKENLAELVQQLIEYRDQSQIMELLGDAISQKDQILKRIMERSQINQHQEQEQFLQQRELEKLLLESSQSVEELDRKIKELSIQNQQLSTSLKEKVDKINELVLKLSEKDQLEASLRNQITELNKKQMSDENEFLKMHEKQLMETFAIKEKTYVHRIQMLEAQLQEKFLSETELKTKIIDLENEIKKYQKLGKQSEVLNTELKEVLLSKQSEIETLKEQINSIHQLHELGHQEFKSKLTQKIKQCMELQSDTSSSPEDKKKQFILCSQFSSLFLFNSQFFSFLLSVIFRINQFMVIMKSTQSQYLQSQIFNLISKTNFKTNEFLFSLFGLFTLLYFTNFHDLIYLFWKSKLYNLYDNKQITFSSSLISFFFEKILTFLANILLETISKFSSRFSLSRDDGNRINQSFERPTSKSQHISSIQIDSSRTVKTDITKIEKESQMNQVFNELKIFNEQSNKPTLSQLKLKTLTNVQITPIMSTMKSNYISRDTSADNKLSSNCYGSVSNIHQNVTTSASNILNPANISQISSSNSQTYHPPLANGGNTAQYLQNRIVPNQKFVFKHPHHPHKIIEMSPISRNSTSSVQNSIYLMKQSSTSTYTQNTPNNNISIIKKSVQ